MMWILAALGLGLLISLAFAAASGAPWVPTWKKDIARLDSLIDWPQGARFYELGAGDARVSYYLAKRFKLDARAVELSLAHILWMHLRNCVGTRIRPLWKNVYHADFSDADILYIFMMDEVNQRLREKLEAELQKGALVIAYVWPFDGWDPLKVDRAPGRPDLFVYQR